jgi:hypothetical protein
MIKQHSKTFKNKGLHMKKLFWLIMVISLPLFLTNKALAGEIEPQAAKILKQMSDYLQGLQQFSVQTEITEDILFDSGQKIQYGRSATVFVRRPDRLKVYSEGDLSKGQLFYDGKTMTLMDLNQNVYSTISVPADIDNALLYAIKNYNLRAPLADLIYTNTYQYLTSGVTSGYYSVLPTPSGISEN